MFTTSVCVIVIACIFFIGISHKNREAQLFLGFIFMVFGCIFLGVFGFYYKEIPKEDLENNSIVEVVSSTKLTDLRFVIILKDQNGNIFAREFATDPPKIFKKIKKGVYDPYPHPPEEIVVLENPTISNVEVHENIAEKE